MTEDELSLAKSYIWERAKGELRALSAAEGHRRLCTNVTAEDRQTRTPVRFRKLDDHIEAFIDMIENLGLNE